LLWVRVAAAVGAWVAIAAFLYVMTPADLRQPDQVGVMAAWGFVGLGSYRLWLSILRWLDARYAARPWSVRFRKIWSFVIYMAYVALLLVVLNTLESRQGGLDWSVLAVIAFFCASAIPLPRMVIPFASPSSVGPAA
jgi:hypothetical protein